MENLLAARLEWFLLNDEEYLRVRSKLAEDLLGCPRRGDDDEKYYATCDHLDKMALVAVEAKYARKV